VRKKTIKTFWILLLLWLPVSCALLGPEDESTSKPAATVSKSPAKRVRKQEFGSLWSEDSTWNEVYSASAGRAPGDIVIVQLDENLKATILQRYDQIVPPPDEPDTKPIDPSADPAEAAKAKAAAAAAAEKNSDKTKGAQTPKVVRAIIQEIRPRGMYEIAGVETVRFGNRTPKVSIEGTVRDRDIDGTDAISSENVLNLKVDVGATPDPTKPSDSADSNPPPTSAGG
jgi:flagellar basal body L-ring protein FlgH